jgi:hypothetical protein
MGLGRRWDDLPVLVKLEKAPKMRAKAMWKQSRVSRAFSTDYRGIRIKITVDPETGKPTTLNFYLGGKLADSAPVSCDLEQAKRLCEKVVKIQVN